MADQMSSELLSYIQASPTSFHATEVSCKLLQSGGFKLISESADWKNLLPGKYVVKKGGSAIVAFSFENRAEIIKNGWRIIGAHTDSPGLKVKPSSDLIYKSYQQVGVEIYGGMILSTWFDRDLSLAGRVIFRNRHGSLQAVNIDFKRPIAFVPNVAVHLEKTHNEGRTINKQKEMPPLIATITGEKLSFEKIILEQMEKEGVRDVENLISYDLFFYDYQQPSFVGLNDEFIASARLDNLANCFLATTSLRDSNSVLPQMLVLNDHEEVGSSSYVGAAGTMLGSIIKRLGEGNEEDFARTIYNSFLVSADNAHAVHPNYVEKHELNHMPEVNRGPVIKVNANQRYSSTSESIAIFSSICKEQGVSYQIFVNRADMGCGSTIGPIISTVIGVRSVDVGLPTLGMHSIRELAGSYDIKQMYKVFSGFFNSSIDKLTVATS